MHGVISGTYAPGVVCWGLFSGETMLALPSGHTPKVPSHSGHAEGARRLVGVPRGRVVGTGSWGMGGAEVTRAGGVTVPPCPLPTSSESCWALREGPSASRDLNRKTPFEE